MRNRRTVLILGAPLASRRIMERRICETPGGAVRLVNLRGRRSWVRALGNGLPARKITGKWNREEKGERLFIRCVGGDGKSDPSPAPTSTYVSLPHARSRAWTFSFSGNIMPSLWVFISFLPCRIEEPKHSRADILSEQRNLVYNSIISVYSRLSLPRRQTVICDYFFSTRAYFR